MFYFVGSSDVANYADDITPYTLNKTMDALLNSLENDTSTLTRWFYDNYGIPGHWYQRISNFLRV